MRKPHQILPRNGSAREALRKAGQFWTPAWVAEGMVAYVVAGGIHSIFDPAVGEGAFFRAARALGTELGIGIDLSGTEIDPKALEQASINGISRDDLGHVQIVDFLFGGANSKRKGIVANPPYIRHHRLSSEMKAQLRIYARKRMGMVIDGRAGLHIYFLLRALEDLENDGRLAFIMPADTCEGIFAKPLWQWISEHYKLDAVVTFAPEATPFPGVDTNPLVFLIRNAPPEPYFQWARCNVPETTEFKDWTLSDCRTASKDGLIVMRREISEGIATGLSRPPLEGQSSAYTLRDFARVMRGIATGANEFFFLTRHQAQDLQIPSEFLLPAIGRTRDAKDFELTKNAIKDLELRGEKTLLFSPDSRPINQFPKPVTDYLERGELLGLHKRALIRTRRPWYKMEVRVPPPILFAYLGRRNARFIRNLANVVPLTGFLCVYPTRTDSEYIEKLWWVLKQPDTLANLTLVGKSYGAGAIKVEPRALENLPLPANLVRESGLSRPEAIQTFLF